MRCPARTSARPSRRHHLPWSSPWPSGRPSSRPSCSPPSCGPPSIGCAGERHVHVVARHLAERVHAPGILPARERGRIILRRGRADQAEPRRDPGQLHRHEPEPGQDQHTGPPQPTPPHVARHDVHPVDLSDSDDPIFLLFPTLRALTRAAAGIGEYRARITHPIRLPLPRRGSPERIPPRRAGRDAGTIGRGPSRARSGGASRPSRYPGPEPSRNRDARERRSVSFDRAARDPDRGACGRDPDGNGRGPLVRG